MSKLHRLFFLRWLALACLVIIAGCLTPLKPDDPNRPALEARRFAKWRHAYWLDNTVMKVVVVPETGRIMYIGLAGGENLLRNNDAVLGKKPTKSWMGYGGDWMWPVSQARWSGFSQGDWPPPDAVGDAPWKAKAWRNPDGSQTCLLTRRFPPPVHAYATRLITLDRNRARVRIRQRMVRMGVSDTPLTLWQISQLTNAERVFLPVTPESAFTNGFRMLMGDVPDSNRLTRCDNTLVFDAMQGGQYKFGSDATNDTWVAAQTGSTLVLLQMVDRGPGTYPDNGCALEVYSSTEDGYVEIETLSREVTLSAGESLENSVTIDCHPMPADLQANHAVEKIRDLLAGTQ